MPRGNKTGPLGQGPMTGRAAGFCAGYAVPGYSDTVDTAQGGYGQGFGRGFGRGGARGVGRGQGFGRGFGRGGAGFGGGYAAPVPGFPPQGAKLSPENERQVLSRQQEYLAQELDAIKKRLADIDDPSSAN